MTSAEMVVAIGDALRVLQTRDGLAISDDQIRDRAGNIAQLVLGELEVAAAGARKLERDRLTAIATATLHLGAAYAEIAKAGDNITAQLEPLIEDHDCERCGARAGKAGAFVLRRGSARVSCAACVSVRW